MGQKLNFIVSVPWSSPAITLVQRCCILYLTDTRVVGLDLELEKSFHSMGMDCVTSCVACANCI